MDCRKWLLLAAGLSCGTAGCITQQQDFGSEKTITTIWTPLSLFQREARRQPHVETCLQGADVMEKMAESDKVDARTREEKLESARKGYQQALDIEPGNVAALAGIARVHALRREFDRAQDDYDKALKAHPKSAGLWAEFGMFHFHQNRYSQAADAFRKAVELEPDDRNHAKNLALNLALAGREQESVQVLTRLYGDAQAHFNYAVLALKAMDRPDAARHHAQLALERDPMFVPAQQLLAKLNHGNTPPAPAALPAPVTQAAPVTHAAPPPPPTPTGGALAGLGFRGD